jgi:hypothetical protein
MASAAAAQAVIAAGKSKTGRRALVTMLVIMFAVPVMIVAVPVGVVMMVISSGGAASAASACGGSAVQAPPPGGVAGFGHDQLVIAGQIVTVGQSKGIDSHGQQIALAVAIGESSLHNLDHGDAVDNTTIGVFQQGAPYGPRAARMDVLTAAGAFYDRMVQVAGWQQMDPGDVGYAIEVGPPAAHYDQHWGPAGAILAAMTSRSGADAAACQVPASAQAAAAALVTAIQSGKLVFEDTRYRQQVFDMADGTSTPQCAIDVHILQAMVLVVNNFQAVGVSDLNRRCTGETPGAGTASQHWKGKAVDFTALNHQSLDGANPVALQMIQLLDPIMPHGSALGQSQCRSAAGDSLNHLVNFTVQFSDTCTHQHLQVP